MDGGEELDMCAPMALALIPTLSRELGVATSQLRSFARSQPLRVLLLPTQLLSERRWVVRHQRSVDTLSYTNNAAVGRSMIN